MEYNTKQYINNLKNMSEEELIERIKTNKIRIKYNNGFFIIFAGITVLTLPIATVPLVVLLAFRDYYLIKNTKEVSKELKLRKHEKSQ